MAEQVFDLIAALTGRSYPFEEVDVYLDEAVAREIERSEGALQIFAMKGDNESHQKLEADRDKLIEKVRASKLVFKVVGNSREEKLDVEDELRARINAENVPGHRQGEELAVLTWTAMVEKITAPNGADVPVTEEVIRAFRLQAPTAAIARIDKAIKAVNGVSQGFELVSQSPDF